jgi:hypothetical protein
MLIVFLPAALPLKNDQKEDFVSINGQQFVDASGQEVIFHGLNLVNKNPGENYLGPDDQETIKNISELGI